MSELSISVGVHCDAQTTISSENFKGSPDCVGYKCLKINGVGYGHANIFLTSKVAAAIHQELERLYPELVGDVPDEVVVRYAEEHSGDGVPFDESDSANPPVTQVEVAAIAKELDDIDKAISGLL